MAVHGKPDFLKRFSPGSGRPSPFSASDLNRIVDAVNKLINLRIVESPFETSVAWDSQGPIIKIRAKPEKIVRESRGSDCSKITVRACDIDTGEILLVSICGEIIS